MKCPIDGENLVMTERQGIEIDYCPKCRGVWLDRGELDKIIERAVPSVAAVAPTPAAPAPSAAPSGGLFAPPPRDDRRYDQHDDRRYDQRPRDRDDDDDHRYRGQDPRYGNDPRYGQDPRYAKRKRGGFLGELFDFD